MKILIVNLEKEEKSSAFLKKTLPIFFGNETIVFPETVKISLNCFSRLRHQWDAKKILSEAKEKLKDEKDAGFHTLLVFPYDLYAGTSKSVFGVAELNGSFALISTFRLGALENENHSSKIFKKRILMEAVHALGHTYGVEHCTNRQCVMGVSKNIPQIDRKNNYFCKKCVSLL